MDKVDEKSREQPPGDHQHLGSGEDADVEIIEIAENKNSGKEVTGQENQENRQKSTKNEASLTIQQQSGQANDEEIGSRAEAVPEASQTQLEGNLRQEGGDLGLQRTSMSSSSSATPGIKEESVSAENAHPEKSLSKVVNDTEDGVNLLEGTGNSLSKHSSAKVEDSEPPETPHLGNDQGDVLITNQALLGSQQAPEEQINGREAPRPQSIEADQQQRVVVRNLENGSVAATALTRGQQTPVFRYAGISNQRRNQVLPANNQLGPPATHSGAQGSRNPNWFQELLRNAHLIYLHCFLGYWSLSVLILYLIIAQTVDMFSRTVHLIGLVVLAPHYLEFHFNYFSKDHKFTKLNRRGYIEATYRGVLTVLRTLIVLTYAIIGCFMSGSKSKVRIDIQTRCCIGYLVLDIISFVELIFTKKTAYLSQIFRKMTVVIRAVTTFEIGTLMSKFDIIEFESRFESLLIFYLTLIFFCPFVCVFFVFLSRSTKGKGLLGVARRKPKLLLRGKIWVYLTIFWLYLISTGSIIIFIFNRDLKENPAVTLALSLAFFANTAFLLFTYVSKHSIINLALQKIVYRNKKKQRSNRIGGPNPAGNEANNGQTSFGLSSLAPNDSVLADLDSELQNDFLLNAIEGSPRGLLGEQSSNTPENNGVVAPAPAGEANEQASGQSLAHQETGVELLNRETPHEPQENDQNNREGEMNETNNENQQNAENEHPDGPIPENTETNQSPPATPEQTNQEEEIIENGENDEEHNTINPTNPNNTLQVANAQDNNTQTQSVVFTSSQVTTNQRSDYSESESIRFIQKASSTVFKPIRDEDIEKMKTIQSDYKKLFKAYQQDSMCLDFSWRVPGTQKQDPIRVVDEFLGQDQKIFKTDNFEKRRKNEPHEPPMQLFGDVEALETKEFTFRAVSQLKVVKNQKIDLKAAGAPDVRISSYLKTDQGNTLKTVFWTPKYGPKGQIFGQKISESGSNQTIKKPIKPDKLALSRHKATIKKSAKHSKHLKAQSSSSGSSKQLKNGKRHHSINIIRVDKKQGRVRHSVQAAPSEQKGSQQVSKKGLNSCSISQNCMNRLLPKKGAEGKGLGFQSVQRLKNRAIDHLHPDFKEPALLVIQPKREARRSVSNSWDDDEGSLRPERGTKRDSVNTSRVSQAPSNQGQPSEAREAGEGGEVPGNLKLTPRSSHHHHSHHHPHCNHHQPRSRATNFDHLKKSIKSLKKASCAEKPSNTEKTEKGSNMIAGDKKEAEADKGSGNKPGNVTGSSSGVEGSASTSQVMEKRRLMLEELISYDPTISKESLCKICQERLSDCMIQPCGHGGVCYKCMEDMLKYHKETCPFCREKIEFMCQIDTLRNYKGIYKIKDIYDLVNENDDPTKRNGGNNVAAVAQPSPVGGNNNHDNNDQAANPREAENLPDEAGQNNDSRTDSSSTSENPAQDSTSNNQPDTPEDNNSQISPGS